jgi:polyphosphate kinase 2 (PPK2 family)
VELIFIYNLIHAIVFELYDLTEEEVVTALENQDTGGKGGTVYFGNIQRIGRELMSRGR